MKPPHLYPLHGSRTRPETRKIVRLIVLYIEHDIRPAVGALVICVIAAVPDDQRAVRSRAHGGDIEPGVALLGRLVAVSAAFSRATEGLELKIPVLAIPDANPVDAGGVPVSLATRNLAVLDLSVHEPDTGCL